MNIFIAYGMFFCYGVGVLIQSKSRDAGVNPWLGVLLSIPFEVGAYVILATQVGLHW